jgi:putative FmdB family regulatory protein
MPIYTYACDSCDSRRDVRHSIHADPERACPDCGGPARRVIQPAGIAFKGSGFYRTDHLPAPRH